MRKVFSRSRLWVLLPCLVVLSSGIAPARAAAVAIANGDTKTGTVTADGVHGYTIRAAAGSAIVLSVSETGNHDEGFTPQLDFKLPDGTWGIGHGQQMYARLEQTRAAEGDWTVNVSRADGHQTSSGYSLKLIQIPGATGTAMSTGRDYSGSITRGGVDVYTFTGTAGRTATVNLTKTGNNGFMPEYEVFSPSGIDVGSLSCPTNCAEDFAISEAGTWTILVWKNDPNDVTGTYKVSVSGN